ncbi:hypothetical protein H8E77_05510 [bacterium]|nr:hypothetical protein [bacterium]
MLNQEIAEIMEEFDCDELEAVNILLQLVAQEENIEELIEDLEEPLLQAA